jgi:uncharacterized protein YxjI
MSMSPSSSAGISVNLPPATEALVREEFAQHRRLSVRQKRRWLELLFNWEGKNSYAIYDEEGNHTLQVKEEGNGFINILKRLFLRTLRPFDATVYDNPIPRPILQLHRPFRFIFSELQVAAADGTPLGKIVREWSWIRRIYRIEDARGAEVARLFGPFFRPWTFEIQVNGEVRGMVQKRWSGALSEIFTDADNFAVEFASIDDPKLKALCFASTVLIDVVHFEDSKHN